MKARKGAGGRPREASKPVDTPVDKLGEKDTIMHYNAVMLEDLKHQMQLVIEFMQTIKVELEQKIDALQNEMNQKFDALNYKIDHKINDLEERLNRRIDDVEARLTLRIDRIADRLDGHESRLVALEACR
jgi:peptidoglycan hydrolase CwlO-like protein